MAEEFSPEEPLKKSRWVRNLAAVGAGLVVLLIVLYFAISSSAFLKSVILPRVGKSMNAKLSVTDASLSPFSQLVLSNLKVQTEGAEPLLTATQVRVRYNLFSILRGKYVVDEITLDAPTVQLVTGPDGRSNLDQVTKGPGAAPTSSSKSDQPLQLLLRNVSIKDGTVRTLARTKEGATQTMELRQLSLSLDRLENGQPGKFKMATLVKLDNRAPAGIVATNDVMEGKLVGDFDFKVDAKLVPQSLTGNANLSLTRGEGTYAELTGLDGQLQAELTPSELRHLTFKFQKGGQPLGVVQASGPLDLSKSEGRIKLEIQSIDRQVLNLFGAAQGWDFANSTLNATNYVDLSQQGSLIGAKGQVVGRQLGIRQKGQQIPTLDLDIAYEASVDLRDQVAVIRQLNVDGTQQGKKLLQASLDRPMTLTWAPNARGFADSTFQLGFSQLNLRDWAPLTGTNEFSGILNAQLNLVAKQDGKLLVSKTSVNVQDFAAQSSTNPLDPLTLTAVIDATVRDFKDITVDQFNLEGQQRNQSLAKSSGSAHYDLSRRDLSFQGTADISLSPLLHQLKVPSWQATNGTIRVSTALSQKGKKYALTGNLSLIDFTGSYADYRFQDWRAGLDYNVDLDQPFVQVHNASLTIRKGYKAGGAVTLRGDWDLQKASGRLNFHVADLNENALAPFLAPMLDPKKLVSIAIEGDGSTTYDPQGETSLKAGLNVTNWVVAMSATDTNPPKLSASIKLDGSMREQVIDVRQFLVNLAPTARAKNEMEIKAHLDLGKTNASPSQFSLQAQSLDVTPYYAMFTDKSGAPKPPPAPPAADHGAPVSATLPPPAVPGPAALPIEQLTANAKIGSLYLGEVIVTNLEIGASLKQGILNLQPVQLNLNGAPVQGNALLNLKVPGYSYDVAFKADKVPIEPLSNTFTTNRPGMLKGDFFGQAQIKGAGTTGVDLKKSLNGNVLLNLTNLNYEIVGPKIKRLLDPIALVLRVPELMQTPLNWIGANLEMGNARIDVQHFSVQSQAFHAESHGPIPIADILTNSPLKLPVNLALRRSLAEKANLLAPNTPTNAIYASLPDFVTLTGTVGDPKTEINKVVIGGLLAKSIAGMVPVGEKAGSIIQGIGGILAGQPSSGSKTNSPSGTNAPSPANLAQDIAGLFNQPKKDRTATNAPSVSTNKPPVSPNKPARPNALDLLNLIPEKK